MGLKGSIGVGRVERGGRGEGRQPGEKEKGGDRALKEG